MKGWRCCLDTSRRIDILNGGNMTSIHHWKVPSASKCWNGMQENRYNLWCEVKAVLSQSASPILTRQDPKLVCRVENIAASLSELMHASIMSMGYESCCVRAFNILHSTENLVGTAFSAANTIGAADSVSVGSITIISNISSISDSSNLRAFHLARYGAQCTFFVLGLIIPMFGDTGSSQVALLHCFYFFPDFQKIFEMSVEFCSIFCPCRLSCVFLCPSPVVTCSCLSTAVHWYSVSL